MLRERQEPMEKAIFKLPRAMRERLAAEADREGVSMAHIVRRALKQHFRDLEEFRRAS